jgi:hypothetical protein
MNTIFCAFIALLSLVCVAFGQCPQDDPSLTKWSESPPLYFADNSTFIINSTESYLLDVSLTDSVYYFQIYGNLGMISFVTPTHIYINSLTHTHTTHTLSTVE